MTSFTFLPFCFVHEYPQLFKVVDEPPMLITKAPLITSGAPCLIGSASLAKATAQELEAFL